MQFLLLGWSEYDPALLATRVVQPLQAFLTDQLQLRCPFSFAFPGSAMPVSLSGLA